MPSLKDLQDETTAFEFASRVEKKVSEFEQRKLSLNHGDCSEQALLKRAKKGMTKSFNYDNLMELKA